MPLIKQCKEFLCSNMKSKNNCWLREHHDKRRSFHSSTTLRSLTLTSGLTPSPNKWVCGSKVIYKLSPKFP